MKMKSRHELIQEIIDLENTAMKFKKGLHLAKKFIDSHVADPDITDEMADNFCVYDAYLDDNKLQEI